MKQTTKQKGKTQNMKSYIEKCPNEWVEAHGYPWLYDESTGTLYWCTNYQCAEKHGKNIIWHSTEFFYDLLKKQRAQETEKKYVKE